MKIESLLPNLDFQMGIAPINLAAGANTGSRILGNCRKVLVVLFKAAGAAGEDPELTMLQHDAASAGNSKALNFTTIYQKLETTLDGDEVWDKVTQAAANTYQDATSGEVEAFIAVEIDTADLDVPNGYKWLSCNVADVGDTSQIGGLFYVKAGFPLIQDAS